MNWLKPNQLRILRHLANNEHGEEGELTRAVPGGWWIGCERQRAQDCLALLRLCLLREEDVNQDGSYFIYTTNEEGRAMAKDPEREPMIIKHMRDRLQKNGDPASPKESNHPDCP